MHALLTDFARQAQQRLEPSVWQYLTDGDRASDLTAFSQVRLLPRPLADVRGGHTRITLFGQEYAHPILLAPIAYQRLFHPSGEIASAMAAAAQDGPFLISSLASQNFQEIAHAYTEAGGVSPWLQLYWQGDRSRTLRLLERAIAAGCSAVVFTVDAPIKQASLHLPQGVAAVNLEPGLALSGQGSAVFDGWMMQAPRWDDLLWLRQQTSLPLLVKGILHPDDAQRVLEIGCDGIVVSDHGGRVLHSSALSISMLPQIAARLAGKIPILFDSGIRSGSDVFTALALGANAVLLGRPYIWGLAADGAMGVAQVIRLLRDELEMTMALTGCARLSDIGSGCLVQ